MAIGVDQLERFPGRADQGCASWWCNSASTARGVAHLSEAARPIAWCPGGAAAVDAVESRWAVRFFLALGAETPTPGTDGNGVRAVRVHGARRWCLAEAGQADLSRAALGLLGAGARRSADSPGAAMARRAIRGGAALHGPRLFVLAAADPQPEEG